MANWKIKVYEAPIDQRELDAWVKYLREQHTNGDSADILRKQIQEHKAAIEYHQKEISKLEELLTKWEQLDPNENIFSNI